jgi:hypothetical protein
MAWENITENIDNAAKHNIVHYKGSSRNCGLMRNDQNHQRKKGKFQWLQDQSHTNADNGELCDVKLANTEAKKKRGYLK